MRENGERTAVLLDRHPLWLDALDSLLTKAEISVVGKTTSPSDALALIARLRPTVFITDYDAISESDGSLPTLNSLAEAGGSIEIVVLSEAEDPARIEAAFSAGAAVYCVKTAEAEDLASAIRQAFQTSVFFAADRKAPEAKQPAKPVEQDLRGLTKREVEILRLVAEGYSNSQLAKMLWVTEQTVKFHLSNIYRKLEVANRTEASRWAHVHGFIAPAERTAA